MMHRTISTVLVFVILWFAAGCDQSDQISSVKTGSSTANLEQHQRHRLDPDSDADSIYYSDLVKKLKPLYKAKRSYRLGVVMKYFGNPYYQRLADGMHAKATELGLEIYFQAGITESDQEGQRAVMEEFINKGYDAILVSPQTDTNLLSAAKSAHEKGILLINVDDALLREADYYIGPSQFESGVLVAKYFIDTIGQGGKVAVIRGHDGDYGVEWQTKGFEDTLKGTAFQVVARPFCVWDLQIAFQAAAAILLKHPDIKGFYCGSDIMALGVVQAVKQAGKTGKVIVVGRDGIEPAYEAIRNREMAATVNVDAFTMGKLAVELTFRILDGQDINSVVFTPQQLITQENVEYK